MGALKNTFSWSWSRHRALRTCPRKYWLQHYGFWGGWRRDHPAREIYIQKKLNSRPQWLGTTVHAAAEWVLGQLRRPGGAPPAPERVVERTLRAARRSIEDSEAGRFRDDPKRRPGFLDHYYELDTPADAWEADLSEIERQVSGLFDNGVFRRLARSTDRIAEVEQLRRLDLDGVPVWVSLDVLVEDGEGGFVVIDWKTGRHHDPDAVARQLGVYGLYVIRAYLGHLPEEEAARRVKVMYVNLRHGDWETRELSGELLSETRDTVRTSAEAMRARLVDPAENTAREADFPPLPEGSPECAHCPYRRSCGRG
jgi:CRISPR/Cas system-associated exonuclease Cas4 (RecB family)